MHYKKYVFIVLASIGLYVAYVSVMVALDPLQIFHEDPDRDGGNLITGMRFQAAGIINNYAFDSIILGASMAANFSPKEASNVFDSHFVNLSLSGSMLSERSLVLNYALRKKKLKNVIITLDGFAPVGKYRDDFPVSNFDFLYNTRRFDDVLVYSNLKYIKYAICKKEVIYTNIPQCHIFKPVETIVEWASLKENYRRFGGLNKWFEANSNAQTTLKNIVLSTRCIKNGCEKPRPYVHNQLIKLENGSASFDQYILKTVRENPETKFHLFFPPYSRLKYAMWAQENRHVFDLYLSTIRHIVNKSGALPNLHIYGFDDMDFLDDISNYKDTRHHRPKFNSEILHWMRNGEHELSGHMLGQYLAKIKYKARHYDVSSIGYKIEQYLKLSKKTAPVKIMRDVHDGTRFSLKKQQTFKR